MITLENAVSSLDKILAKQYCAKGEYERGLKLYKELLEVLEGAEKEEIQKVFMQEALKASTVLVKNKKWEEALELYRDLMKYPNFPDVVFKNVGLCLSVLKKGNEALEFFEAYRVRHSQDFDVYEFMGEVSAEYLKDLRRAISYYEEALKRNDKKSTLYSQLAHLYSTLYRDNEKEKQLFYASKALELDPNNRIVVKNGAFIYSKFGDIKMADYLYGRLMFLKPTHSDLHSYGAYLVRNGRFNAGFKFLRHRFQKEDLEGLIFPEIFYGDKVWDGESSIDDKKVLVHFEQGFGDTVMFVRYVELIKDRCKKIYVVVQDSLLDLIKDSKLGVPVYGEAEAKDLTLDYDVVIPMMDLPLVCDTTPENIPNVEKYLKVPKAKITEFQKKYIKDKKKFKVGIAFEGSIYSKRTRRDVPLKFFYPLMKLSNVDVYLLQVGDLEGQVPKVPSDCKYIDLGSTFKNWEDTACAVESMDLVITSDNGVMNLAGSLGKKTFGIFNSITEWRWIKTTGEDIAWYKSVKPFQCEQNEEWETPMNKAIEEVKKLAS